MKKMIAITPREIGETFAETVHENYKYTSDVIRDAQNGAFDFDFAYDVSPSGEYETWFGVRAVMNPFDETYSVMLTSGYWGGDCGGIYMMSEMSLEDDDIAHEFATMIVDGVENSYGCKLGIDEDVYVEYGKEN